MARRREFDKPAVGRGEVRIPEAFDRPGRLRRLKEPDALFPQRVEPPSLEPHRVARAAERTRLLKPAERLTDDGKAPQPQRRGHKDDCRHESPSYERGR